MSIHFYKNIWFRLFFKNSYPFLLLFTNVSVIFKHTQYVSFPDIIFFFFFFFFSIASLRSQKLEPLAKTYYFFFLHFSNSYYYLQKQNNQLNDSFERLLILLNNIGVTILLSLTVFLNMVAETMPATSDAVPLLGTTHNKQTMPFQTCSLPPHTNKRTNERTNLFLFPNFPE